MDITTLIAILGSAGFTAAVSGVIGLLSDRQKMKSELKNKDDEKTALLKEATREVLFILLDNNAERYVHRGYIKPNELRDFLRQHDLYHNKLDGNGYMDQRVEQVRNLPCHE